MKRKKKSIPTPEEAKRKIDELRSNIAAIEQKSKSSRSPMVAFLSSVQEVIIPAIESGMSYRVVAESLTETYGVKVNPTTLSRFVKSVTSSGTDEVDSASSPSSSEDGEAGHQETNTSAY